MSNKTTIKNDEFILKQLKLWINKELDKVYKLRDSMEEKQDLKQLCRYIGQEQAFIIVREKILEME